MIAIKSLIIFGLLFLLVRSITKSFVSSVKDAYIEGKTPPQNFKTDARKQKTKTRKFNGGEEIEFEEV
ncbi:MAG: hypothetical protein ACPG5B_05625 [Chitinophagales bacterium]